MPQTARLRILVVWFAKMIRILFCVLLTCVVARAQTAAPSAKLAVVLVVDQMLPDYLDRYGDLYQGGLARLSREGAVFDHAYHDHSCTLTGPGHATLSTGMLPAHHGIVGNYWWDRREGREVYSCGDSAATIVGHPQLKGVSPVRLLCSTFTERHRSEHPGARVVSVALKDRSAVLLAGRSADLVLWWDADVGEMVTSSWYADAVPAWVSDFQPRIAGLADSTWTRLLPDSAYRRSDPDRYQYEHDGMHSEFPHACQSRAKSSEPACFSELYYLPFGDLAVLELAQLAVDHLALGGDSVPDLLLVGCSAADGIGHRYGPDSHEVQDYYLRLDRGLAKLFNHLDSTAGKGQWLLALSSDHGVLPLPERDRERGILSRRVSTDSVAAQIQRLSAAVSAERGVSLEVLRVEGGIAFTVDVWNDGPLAAAALDLATRLRTLDWIADVFTWPELGGTAVPDRPYALPFRNAFHAGRAADLILREHDRVIVTSRSTGTTHGSPYVYDTHVPLAFMGPGIRPARISDSVRTVDLAPTLCAYLGHSTATEFDGVSLLPRLAR